MVTLSEELIVALPTHDRRAVVQTILELGTAGRLLGYVQNVARFPRVLAQSSVLSTAGQGWNMRFVLTACYPAAGWNPPTTGPTNHGQAQTLLRYRP